ncbi:BTB/POZ domain-containing protein [Acorus calamus]|uniref:BTB/POZ domain-containing protein n=1 Tax=Acorus calamus TaxID=4465 RepID=A0AAV9DE37_ACOCL|nr:BTB/POZ domain-containing protein [Acorus calamus]
MVLRSQTSSRMYDYKSVSERDTELLKAEENVMVKCISCKKRYGESEAGTCKECYEEASKTKEELKRDRRPQIQDLLPTPPFPSPQPPPLRRSPPPALLRRRRLPHPAVPSTGIHAHKAVLMSRSPVFKAILEKTRSGTIKIVDVSYDVLRSFVHYLYTAEVLLDERMTCDLLVLAKKYQVKHLKSYCEKFMTSKVNSENAIVTFTFAH